MKNLNYEVVGKSFSELNEDEMIEIVGGTNSDEKAITPVISIITKTISQAASGFSVSWIVTGMHNCKSVE